MGAKLRRISYGGQLREYIIAVKVLVWITRAATNKPGERKFSEA